MAMSSSLTSEPCARHRSIRPASCVELEPGEFPLASDKVGQVLAAQPIHVTREFYAELLKELLVTSA
jgi:hypothetical protein